MEEDGEQTSHKQILKSTGILGSVQVISILIRIIRNKIVAVLLGPVGIGIVGLYQSTLDIVRSSTGFGLNLSAIRDIAEAVGSDDPKRISRTITILRRWVWFTGLLGMVITFVFSKPLSLYAFDDAKYSIGLKALSLVLLMDSLSGGQLALLQGLRRIGSMATANVLGVLSGFCITVPLYWLMGFKGIVPALILSSAASLFLSWYYSRRVPTEPVAVSAGETFRGGLGMVRLGLFMVVTGFATTASMYIVRVYISKQSGVEGVGLFQAAWNLSSIYIATVLQSMGTDYFPRLSAVNNKNDEVVRLANEQTEVALLIAGPLIVGMLSFMSLVVYMLYSSKFNQAVPILQWQLSGAYLKVATWPIAFIILAKSRGSIYVFTELFWNGLYLCLIHFGWQLLGLEVTGAAYLIAFVFYLSIVYIIGRKLCGFRWTISSVKHFVIFGAATVIAFLDSRFLSGIKGYVVGIVLTGAAVGYSYYELRKIVDIRSIIRKVFKRK